MNLISIINAEGKNETIMMKLYKYYDKEDFHKSLEYTSKAKSNNVQVIDIAVEVDPEFSVEARKTWDFPKDDTNPKDVNLELISLEQALISREKKEKFYENEYKENFFLFIARTIKNDNNVVKHYLSDYIDMFLLTPDSVKWKKAAGLEDKSIYDEILN